MDADRIRVMAIVTESFCREGVGSKAGEHTFEVIMIVTSGERRGEEIDKRYTFLDDPPDYLRRDMLRLGFLIRTADELASIPKRLVGMILRVSLVKDGDASHVYIEDYFGQDDPKKYRQ